MHVHHGSNRLEAISELENADVVLTTYETLRSEFLRSHSRPLFEHRWARIILDEGMSTSLFLFFFCPFFFFLSLQEKKRSDFLRIAP